MVLRITLDVNVWVNHYLSLAKGRTGTAAQRLVACAFAGHCRLGPVQPILSHAMLDTMQGVLLRLGLPEGLAEDARTAVESAAAGGVVRQAPYAVLGGGVQPLKDAEDAAVLETAIAGRADLLITHNMRDFVPGARADIDAQVVRVDANGNPDVLQLTHVGLRHALVIASVFAAKAWLLDGIAPPVAIGRQ